MFALGEFEQDFDSHARERMSNKQGQKSCVIGQDVLVGRRDEIVG